jgi:hypothetical protein
MAGEASAVEFSDFTITCLHEVFALRDEVLGLPQWRRYHASLAIPKHPVAAPRKRMSKS